MSSDTAPSAPAKAESKLAAQIVAIAMVIGGIAGLYYGWHFSATYDPSSSPNFFGTGWILEAAFWTLRAVPGWVIFGLLVALGALALHGMAQPQKAKPPVVRDDEGPGPDSAGDGSGLHFG